MIHSDTVPNAICSAFPSERVGAAALIAAIKLSISVFKIAPGAEPPCGPAKASRRDRPVSALITFS